MVDIQTLKPHKLSCHCQAVHIELQLDTTLDTPRRCDCSMCSRRGTIVASVLLDNLKIIQGQDSLSMYQFGTMTAKHYFCKICGIYTHHQRRSNPHQFAFNVFCLETLNQFDISKISLMDGVNHPKDR